MTRPSGTVGTIWDQGHIFLIFMYHSFRHEHLKNMFGCPLIKLHFDGAGT